MNQSNFCPAIGGLGLLISSTAFAQSSVTDAVALSVVADSETGGVIEHCDEVIAERDFAAIFDCGDELFESRFNAIDGVGIEVGDGGRFTRVPRADLSATFGSNIPARETGPNGEACNLCHFDGADAGDGAGPGAVQHIRDPLHSANPGQFIQRQAPHIFGPGAVQLLAEEMTADLQGITMRTRQLACESGGVETGPLVTKGVSFGVVSASCAQIDLSGIEGIDPDLVVKPFEWKGVETTLRSFSRGAFHMELGMQPVELTGDDVDGDFDGVTNEIFVEDVSAMAVYLAAQPRPTTTVELADLKLQLNRFGFFGRRAAAGLGLPDLTAEQRAAIANGEARFSEIGCAGCHVPTLETEGTIFSEPSQNPNYRDVVFPAGQDPVARGVDPANPITFDITRDQPNNVIMVGRRVVKRLGSFDRTSSGGAAVNLFSDLKRHDLGPEVAEQIDAPPCNCGASVFLTETLWGVGGTAPYLHDGRATTLTEAIALHGGEAAASRTHFRGLSSSDRADVIAFLNNLVLFFPPSE